MTPQLFKQLREKAATFRHDRAAQRIERLRRLENWISSHEDAIVAALSADFNKPSFETVLSEIYPALTEIRHAIQHLKSWMKDKTVKTPAVLMGHRSFIRYENKGTVLVIGPWNYPFQIAVIPAVSALAAGNTVVVKPSELTPKTAELIKKMFTECFSSDEVCVELGGREVTTELLKYDFDHVFFTGSTQVGRVIAAACAERLIPYTLELGGKSPTIVDESADLDDAAEKIFWGKFLNRGQTCIAPDYLVIHENAVTPLTEKLRRLGSNFDNLDKAHIINERNHERLNAMLEERHDLNARTLTLVPMTDAQHPTMKDEIFGPILPYLSFKTRDDLRRVVLQQDKPLSLYVFAKNRDFIEFVLRTFTSGSVGINAVAVQFGNPHLPFGGLGASGVGSYHGFSGFKEFSHARSIISHEHLKRTRRLLLPPYSNWKVMILDFIKKFF